jgi:D-amino-acid dehydrogenase
MGQGTQEIVVIGAGIVGVVTALSLQKEGHRVTIVDPEPPGQGASFGNAGSLAPGSIIPLGLPGTFRQVPKWVLDPLGPLAISWRHLPRVLPWLMRFSKSCNAESAAHAARAMRSLNKGSVHDYAQLLGEAGASDLLRRDGMLHAYRTESGFMGSAYGRKLRTDNEAEVVIVTEADIRRMAPALAPEYRYGFTLPDGGNVRSPHRVVTTLCDYFLRNGGTLLREKATGFAMSGGGVRGVRTSTGVIDASAVVLAAGIASRPLATELGVRVPLVGERGYHIEIPAPGVQLDMPVTDGEGRFVATPMEGGIRVAGTSEFAPYGSEPNWKRTEALSRLAQGMLPGIKVEPHSRWMGHRPSTPDSIPVIGRSPTLSNAYFAFGHGHWGLMASPATGQAIAALVAGRQTPFDISPFNPLRFE